MFSLRLGDFYTQRRASAVPADNVALRKEVAVGNKLWQ